MARGQRNKRANRKKNKSSVEKRNHKSRTNGRTTKLSAVIPRDEEQPSTSGLKETSQHKRKKSPDFVCSLSKRQINARKKPCSTCDFECHQDIKQVATSSFNLPKKLPVESAPKEAPVAEPQKYFLRRRQTLVTGDKTIGNSKTAKETKKKEQLNAVVEKEKAKNTKKPPKVKLKVNPVNESSSAEPSTSTAKSNGLPSILNLNEYLGCSMLVEPHEKRHNGHFFSRFPETIRLTRGLAILMLNLALRRVKASRTTEEKNRTIDSTTSNMDVDPTTSNMDVDSTTSNKLNNNSTNEYSDSSSDPSSDTDDENIATGLFKFRKSMYII